MAKYKIGSIGITLRSHYNSNLGFQVRVSRLNQYLSKQSYATNANRITLNKLLKAVTSLA